MGAASQAGRRPAEKEHLNTSTPQHLNIIEAAKKTASTYNYLFCNLEHSFKLHHKDSKKNQIFYSLRRFFSSSICFCASSRAERQSSNVCIYFWTTI